MQGTAVGAIVGGIPLTDGRFTGGPLFWLQPLALNCGLGLCIGYALMGASWLVGKTDGALRDLAYRVIPGLLAALLAFLALALALALARYLQVMNRWIDRPYLTVFPALGLAASVALVTAWRRRIDWIPFPATATIFVAAFGTLAASFLPYMIPYSITIDEAAAPASSLQFLFWGAGIIVLPITLIYTIAVYVIFRGKVASEPEGY